MSSVFVACRNPLYFLPQIRNIHTNSIVHAGHDFLEILILPFCFNRVSTSHSMSPCDSLFNSGMSFICLGTNSSVCPANSWSGSIKNFLAYILSSLVPRKSSATATSEMNRHVNEPCPQSFVDTRILPTSNFLYSSSSLPTDSCLMYASTSSILSSSSRLCSIRRSRSS